MSQWLDYDEAMHCMEDECGDVRMQLVFNQQHNSWCIIFPRSNPSIGSASGLTARMFVRHPVLNSLLREGWIIGAMNCETVPHSVFPLYPPGSDVHGRGFYSLVNGKLFFQDQPDDDWYTVS